MSWARWGAPTGLLPAVSAALIGIRRAKTDAKASQKTDVVSATITGPALLAAGIPDLKAVGRIADVQFVEAEEIEVRDNRARRGRGVIRDIAPGDRDAWRELFRAYGVFYETDFSDEQLDWVWSLLTTAGSGVDALVAEDNGRVVGFAHYRSHPDTFSRGPRLVLGRPVR